MLGHTLGGNGKTHKASLWIAYFQAEV